MERTTPTRPPLNRHSLPILDADGHHRRRPKRRNEVGTALAYNALMNRRARKHVWAHGNSSSNNNDNNDKK